MIVALREWCQHCEVLKVFKTNTKMDKHPRCSVGVKHNQDCFQSYFVKKDFSVSNPFDLDPDLLKTLKYRVNMDCIPNICNHHLAAYTKCFNNHTKRSKFCSDPFKIHSSDHRPTGKKIVSLKLCDLLCENKVELNIPIFPGLKVCANCLTRLSSAIHSMQKLTTSSTSSLEDMEMAFSNVDDNVFVSPQHGVNIANKAAEVLGLTPLKVDLKESKSARLQRIWKKGEQVRGKYEEVLHESLINEVVIPSSSEDSGNYLQSDFELLMSELKERCSKLKLEKDQSAILSLLTLAPISWTISFTAEFFSVSEWEVRRARILKKEKGILETPNKKKGRAMTDDEKQIIREFYESDEHSRMQPGMKDTVSVRVEAGQKKIKVQKRLLLMNIDELYFKFKEFSLNTLFMKACGRSKFFTLRPEHVVEVGSRGTHNVCVCEKHQNVKLMIDALCNKNVEKHLFMDRIVCDINAYDCMMKKCVRCPGIASLRLQIVQLIGDRTTVRYKSWVSTDRTMLENKECNVSVFIDTFLQKIDGLTIHHFVAKQQSKFCREMKQNLLPEDCLIQGDFSQNYSMFVQDSTQSSFFNPVGQATIHPFIVYANISGKITPHSIAVISDCNVHNTVAVHSFLRPVLNYVKELCPIVKNVNYFTDGAASQYKNYKNIANLIHHFEDFGLNAEWHYFATSHGKGPCDGTGGTIKRLARRKSLQSINNSSEDIQTPVALFEFANSNIENIKFFYVSTEDIKANEEHLVKRFESAKTLPGTQSFHKFKPLNSTTVTASELSCSLVAKQFVIIQPQQSELRIDFNKIHVNSVVACLYEETGEWYLATVKEKNNEDFELSVHFFKPCGNQTELQGFRKSARDDTALMPLKNIIKIVETLENTTRRSRTYKMGTEERSENENLFSEMMKNSAH